MEQDQPPRRSHHLLKLPPHFESLPKFPSKRRKVNRRGTYISTSQTCDYPVMGTESSLNDTGSPSTPIPSVVSGIPSTPSATMVVVSRGSHPYSYPACGFYSTHSNEPFRVSFWYTRIQFSVHTFGL
jgi:hypothetical protein